MVSRIKPKISAVKKPVSFGDASAYEYWFTQVENKQKVNAVIGSVLFINRLSFLDIRRLSIL